MGDHSQPWWWLPVQALSKVRWAVLVIEWLGEAPQPEVLLTPLAPQPSLSLGYLFLGPFLPFSLQVNSLWNLMFITEYGHNQLQNAHTTLAKKCPKQFREMRTRQRPPNRQRQKGRSSFYCRATLLMTL